MNRIRTILCSLLLIGSLCPPDFASGEPLAIYDGLGDSHSFQPTSFLNIGGDLFESQHARFSQAQSFTVPPSQNFYLTSVELALTSKSHVKSVEIQILGNKQQGRLRAPWGNYILDTFQVTLSPLQTYSGFPDEDSLLTLTSTQGPLLIAGETYWIVLNSEEAISPDDIQWWDASLSSKHGNTYHAQRVNDSPWNVDTSDGPGQAFRVKGNPVPQQDIPGYSFKSIADTGGIFKKFDRKRTLSLNNQDTVAFWGELDNGHQGIFTGDGTSLSYLAISTTKHLGIKEFGVTPSINSANTVAFLGRHADHLERLFVQGKDKAIPIADGNGPLPSLRRTFHQRSRHRGLPGRITRTWRRYFFSSIRDRAHDCQHPWTLFRIF